MTTTTRGQAVAACSARRAEPQELALHAGGGFIYSAR